MRSRRTTVRRVADRGRYDAETIHAILDEAAVAHVGFAVDGQPYVIPTLHARDGDQLFVHGSVGSRMLQALRAGDTPCCVTVTTVDGLVLARSAFHHSINYRSVVVLGSPREVTDPDRKLAALRLFVEKLVPGRWDEARQPSAAELRKTAVLALTIDEASAKVRSGPPVDEDEDYDLPVWAGVLPLRLTAGAPVPDPQLRGSPPLPAGLALWALEPAAEGGREATTHVN
jgi:nitroimidazol reductase NimA-like FMN-containing flavoprotein (pyridoxamine 5'-phosphate oxidase superfamily)